MAFLRIETDKTEVNYQTSFTYIISASFSGLTGDLNDADITVLLPQYVDFVLPKPVFPVTNVYSQQTLLGTMVHFYIGTITDTGIGVLAELRCNFNLDTAIPGQSFTSEAELLIGGETIFSETSEEVKLVVNGIWDLSLELISPLEQNPTPGSSAYLKINLTNSGDEGARLEALKFFFSCPLYTTLDPIFIPYGEDWSGKDSSADATAVVQGNTFTLEATSYSGTDYNIIVKLLLDNDTPLGEVITTDISLETANEEELIGSSTFTVSESSPESAVNLYLPTYITEGNEFYFELYSSNRGNVPLTNFKVFLKFDDNLEINYYHLGNFGDRITGELLNDGITAYLNSTPYNYQDSYNSYWSYQTSTTAVTSYELDIPNVPINFTEFNGPRFKGVLTSVPDSKANIKATISYELETDETITTTQNYSINTTTYPVSDIRGNKARRSPRYVLPGENIVYRANFSGFASQIENPVMLDLLPQEVEYSGNINLLYLDYSENYKRYSSENNPSYFPTPKVEEFENYEGSGRTLLKITLEPFTITQRSNLYIDFEVSVLPRYNGLTQGNQIYLANIGESQSLGGFLDVNDIDGDSLRNELIATTNTVKSEIGRLATYFTDKKIKGELNSDFIEHPLIAESYSGGKLTYQMTFKVLGNIDFSEIEAIDILPHVGDTGVILNEMPRYSEFDVYFKKNPVIQYNSIFEGDEIPTVKILYSQSYDPVRFDESGTGTIGTVDDWSETIPNVRTSIKAIKILSNGTFRPGMSFTILFYGVTPLNSELNNVAWNSFAVRVKTSDGSYLPTAEPEKAGITIREKPEKYSKEAKRILLGSIGMEGLSVSHYVNAEAEKIQYSLGTLKVGENDDGSDKFTDVQSLTDILKTNKSANKSLRDIAKYQTLLDMKLSDMSDF